MVNIVKDVADLTTIPEDDLQKLIHKATWCICEAVEENNLKDEAITTVDIGIGTLTIVNEEDIISYNFVPSKKLERSLIKTIVEEKNPLKIILEKTLCSRIINTYKDIF